MTSFRLQSGAEADLADALIWYDDQAPGLGLEFLRAVEAVFATIERLPHSFPIVYHGMRRTLVRRFPYAVFYRVESNAPVIIACVHCRSHPRRWQSRA
jgi:plasmid stabilization system protein ParE